MEDTTYRIIIGFLIIVILVLLWYRYRTDDVTYLPPIFDSPDDILTTPVVIDPEVNSTTAPAPDPAGASEGMHGHRRGCHCSICVINPEGVFTAGQMQYYKEGMDVTKGDPTIKNYTDLITNVAVDQTTRDNHKQFTKELPAYSAVVTGRTQAFAGEGLGYNAHNRMGIKWGGGVTPVAVGNPTQVTETQKDDLGSTDNNPLSRSQFNPYYN